MKLRPALLLTGTVGPVPEVLVAYIFSVLPTQPLSSDLILDPAQPAFRSTHLKVRSALRLHKLATIHASSLARRLGVLEAVQRVLVASKLRTLLNLDALRETPESPS
ncbi:MAG: type II toxin-antitoxin system PemK/MazF family toxin [Acidobacteria bacterium]|mgnify:CR=1 FL=1|nr:type II toxin-antitoxin system PemK/MazF family toxin [Acidobacteriota bacterium]